MTVLDADDLREVRKALRAAHAKGEAAGYDRARRELDAGVSFVKATLALPEWVLKGFDENKHARDHGKFAKKPGADRPPEEHVAWHRRAAEHHGGAVDAHAAAAPAALAEFRRHWEASNPGLVGRIAAHVAEDTRGGYAAAEHLARQVALAAGGIGTPAGMSAHVLLAKLSGHNDALKKYDRHNDRADAIEAAAARKPERDRRAAEKAERSRAAAAVRPHVARLAAMNADSPAHLGVNPTGAAADLEAALAEMVDDAGRPLRNPPAALLERVAAAAAAVAGGGLKPEDGYDEDDAETVLEFASKAKQVADAALAATVRKAFNPDEPRAADGKFGSGGGSSSTVEHEADPDAALHAETADGGAKARGVFAKVADRFNRFLLDNAGLVGRAGQALSAVDKLLTTPEDVARNPWLAGKFSAGGDQSGDAVGAAFGVPGHLAARFAAAALVKGWAAVKRSVGKALADDPHGAAGELLAGLVNAVREEIGLPPLDHAATAAEFAGHLRGGAGQDDATPDVNEVLLRVMVEVAHDALEAGEDPAPAVNRVLELAADPQQLAAALAEGGAGGETVEKAVGAWVVRKAEYDDKKHPRGKDGRFIPGHEIEAAKGDPAKAAALEAKVKPEDRGKLAAALGKVKTTGQYGAWGRAARDAEPPPVPLAERRATVRERGEKIVAKLKRAGDLRGRFTADDLHDLADHLKSGEVTVAHLRELRRAMQGGLATNVGFGGASRKDAMVAALTAHAKNHALSLQLAGATDAGPPETLEDTPATVATPDDGGREPTLEELETGVRPSQGNRRAGHQDTNSRPYPAAAGEPDAGKPGWDAPASGPIPEEQANAIDVAGNRGGDAGTGGDDDVGGLGRPVDTGGVGGEPPPAVGGDGTPPTGLTQPEKPKVEYVRAKAGGQVSEVDGKFYAGGRLMPIHGRYSGQEKPPKGDGVNAAATPADPNSDGGEGGGGKGGPRGPQLSTEERAAKADAQRKWDEMNAGPLGKLTWLGTSPNGKAFDPKTRGTKLREWREFAEQAGPERIKHIIATLEPELHAAVDAQAPDPESAAWFKDNAKQQAADSVAFMPGGKGHEKKVPGSHYARHLVSEMMDPTNNPGRSPVDIYHRLNGILANPPASRTPRAGAADAAPTADESAAAGTPVAGKPTRDQLDRDVLRAYFEHADRGRTLGHSPDVLKIGDELAAKHGITRQQFHDHLQGMMDRDMLVSRVTNDPHVSHPGVRDELMRQRNGLPVGWLGMNADQEAAAKRLLATPPA